MENFEGNPRRIKEKNVYLLHLDAPRIIILTVIIIGSIAGAFLFGMHFMKQNKNDMSFAKNDLLIDEHRELSMMNNGIPDLSENDQLSRGNETKNDTLLADDPDIVSTLNEKKSTLDDAADVITKDDVKKITSKKVAPPKVKRHVAKKTTKTKNKIARKTNKVQRRSVEKRSSNEEKGSVVEVAATEIHKNRRSSGSDFAIQIASYDSKSKADKELQNLRKNRYNAYVDRSLVNGKTYFRVRIGPIRSKKHAIDMLDNIQSNPRYEESYMVKE